MIDSKLKVFEILDKESAILVSGVERPNPMTVGWGSFGTVWGKPAVTVFVRPTRFSFHLMMENNEFSLNFLKPEFRSAINICGTKSGKDTDKWKEAKITKEPSLKIKTPTIKEAYLSIECATIARVKLSKEDFLASEINDFYPKLDYHTMFIGEVVNIIER
jgi:flavin reductase (DIM6/NTAB) family NADH-FMN oxidoreductase RutF